MAPRVAGQIKKLAVIDMQAAIANTKEGQAHIAELQKKYGPKEQELQKLSQEIQAKQDQLKKTQNTISEEARADMEAQIKKLQTTLQRDADDAQTSEAWPVFAHTLPPVSGFAPVQWSEPRASPVQETLFRRARMPYSFIPTAFDVDTSKAPHTIEP